MAKNTPKSEGHGTLGAWFRRLIIGKRTEWEGFLGANQVNYGVTVNQKTALKFTAVFAAVKILSENIASLPRMVTEMTSDGDVPAPSHPAARLQRDNAHQGQRLRQDRAQPYHRTARGSPHP